MINTWKFKARSFYNPLLSPSIKTRCRDKFSFSECLVLLQYYGGKTTITSLVRCVHNILPEMNTQTCVLWCIKYILQTLLAYCCSQIIDLLFILCAIVVVLYPFWSTLKWLNLWREKNTCVHLSNWIHLLQIVWWEKNEDFHFVNTIEIMNNNIFLLA